MCLGQRNIYGAWEESGVFGPRVEIKGRNITFYWRCRPVLRTHFKTQSDGSGLKIILKNKNEAPTRLYKLRKARGLTQSELAELSGVSLRMIQLYEQRQNDINKASGKTINDLAKALCCNFYEVMEIDLSR